MLEKRFPKLLGDRLITAVELADLKKAEKQGYSIDMILKTMKDAKDRVDQVEVRRVFNWRRLLLLGWTLFGLTAIALLAVYPICALFELIYSRPDPVLTLTYNISALVGCALVYALPLLAIYCWRRRKETAYILLRRWRPLGLGGTLFAYTQAVKVDESM